MSQETDTQPEPQAPSAGQPAKAEAPPQEDYFGQLLKLKAEFENYRKRIDREKPELYKQGKADMLLKLLPIFDVLRKAHAEIQASHAATPLAQGMDLIFKEFEKLFKDEGVTVMEPVGKPYDPVKHDVLRASPKEGAADGEVCEVLQDGYMLGERVLRPAKVCIARGA